MSGYTKLFSSITDSTIWQAPDATRIVWITMLAMCDQHGRVEASVPGLASRARVALADCITALEYFRQPDEWSRTKDFEGRRITDIEGGWVLLNHAKHRAIRDSDERREQARIAMQKLREKRRQAAVSTVNNVSHGEPPLAHTEADTDAATDKRLPRPSSLPERKAVSSNGSGTKKTPARGHEKEIRNGARVAEPTRVGALLPKIFKAPR